MSRAERVESGLQLLLMLGVGGVAAAASWSHVLALAEQHGQGGWLSWAVAACIETAAVSGGLEVRRRHRRRDSARGAVAVVAAATALQLAAQVAEAERSPWGIVLAAVPAVTFLVLVKLALSRTGDGDVTAEATEPAPALAVEVLAPTPVAGPALEEPAAVAAAAPENEAAADDELLPVGREVADELAREGRRLTRTLLIEGLRARGHGVGTTRATELLRDLRTAA